MKSEWAYIAGWVAGVCAGIAALLHVDFPALISAMTLVLICTIGMDLCDLKRKG